MEGGGGTTAPCDCFETAYAVPCCIKEPTPNQKLFSNVKLFSTTSDPGLQGWASYHSYGLNLELGKQEGLILFVIFFK